MNKFEHLTKQQLSVLLARRGDERKYIKKQLSILDIEIKEIAQLLGKLPNDKEEL